jgi:hypothetical protein
MKSLRRITGQRPGRHDQVPAMHNERRRGQRPGHHDQLPARRRGHRPAQNDQASVTHSEAAAWALRPNTGDALRATPRSTAWTPRPSPCDVKAFVVNSEPHTGARPSIRACVVPELFAVRAECECLVAESFPPCARTRGS